MSLLDDTRFVERQHFFDGQRLFAEDMQALEGFDREMRWLHNRSLHQPGIGNGFAVRGRKGDRKVTVEPGYAIDADGREIVLIENEELDVPPVASEKNGEPVFYDLVVSYPDDAALEVAETRAGVCMPRGAVRLREKPVFCWVRLARTETGARLSDASRDGGPAQESLVAVDGHLGAAIKRGLRLVVARAEVLNCQLNRDLSIAERRSARPTLGPHLGCGVHAPEPWPVYWWSMEDDLRGFLADAIADRLSNSESIAFSAPPAATLAAALLAPLGRQGLLGALGPLVLPLGLEAAVPTGAACFRAAPHYTAQLGGERPGKVDLIAMLEEHGLLDVAALSAEARKQLQALRDELSWDVYWDGLISVLDPQPGQFTAHVAIMVQLLDIPDLRGVLNLVRQVGLQDHVVEQFNSTALGQKLQECRDLSGTARQQCILEAVEITMDMIENLLLELLEPLNWHLTWMGVEG